MSNALDIINAQLADNIRGVNENSGKPSLVIEETVHRLLAQAATWHHPIGHGPLQLTYSFMDASNTPEFATNPAHQSLTDEQRAVVTEALESWSDVANIEFQESLGDADIKYALTADGITSSGVTLTHETEHGELESAHIWLNAGNAPVAPGAYSNMVIAHETGHALGLVHPGNYDSSSGEPLSYAANAQYVEDSSAYTLMSYWSEFNVGGDFKGHYPSAPMMDDIFAIQTVYGHNPTAFAGDTIYGFGSNTGRARFSAEGPDDKLIFCVWDAGGNDTFNFSGYHQDQVINLMPGSFSNVGGLTKNVSIAHGTLIENAIGGEGNDVLIGNDAPNMLMGGGGNDILYGGKGSDILVGGDGVNTFIYRDITDSTASAPDCILDFKQGVDLLDLSGVASHLTGTINANYDPETHNTQLVASTDGAEAFVVNLIGTINLQTDLVLE